MKPLLERTNKNSKCYRQAAEKIVRDMLDVSNRQYLDCMLSSSHPRLNALTSVEQRQYTAAFVPYYIAGDQRGTPVDETDRIVQGEIFAETRRLRDTPYPRAVGSLIVPGQCPKTQAVLNRMVTALDRAGIWSRIVETPLPSLATQKKIDRLEDLMQRFVQRIQKGQPGLRSRLTRLYEAQSRLLDAEG